MHDKFDIGSKEDRIVYVRPVKPEDLPDEMKAATSGLGEIYAIQSADGRFLGLAKDRAMAFYVARQNELAPMSVH